MSRYFWRFINKFRKQPTTKSGILKRWAKENGIKIIDVPLPTTLSPVELIGVPQPRRWATGYGHSYNVDDKAIDLVIDELQHQLTKEMFYLDCPTEEYLDVSNEALDAIDERFDRLMEEL